jgi:uncharacterized protein (TIGR02646 family)
VTTVLRIPPRELPESVATSLRAWQADVDRHLDYPTRVSEADRLYHSRSQLAPFAAVRSTLAGMCPGAERCMYCEDSAGQQVDHFRPKSLYPEAVFAWLNFLYACSGCNTPKNNEFAILTGDRPISVTRKKGAPIVPPLAGPAALLDPRQEDLMAFLEVVLPETFEVRPRLGLSAEDNARARYTISTLRLNKRELLRKSRSHTYRTLIALLEQYIARRDDGRRDDVGLIEHEIRIAPHPAVWFEMRRQHARIDELRRLFERAPEALTWDWLPDV